MRKHERRCVLKLFRQVLGTEVLYVQMEGQWTSFPLQYRYYYDMLQLYNVVAFVACFLFFFKGLRGNLTTARNAFEFSSQLRTTTGTLYADTFNMPITYQKWAWEKRGAH